MDKQIIVYEPTEQVKMEVKTDGETVWLTIDQMAMLFGRDKSVIGKHVRNVFAEGELPEEGFRQILPKPLLLAAGAAPQDRLWRETRRNLGCALRSGEVAGSKRARAGRRVTFSIGSRENVLRRTRRFVI